MSAGLSNTARMNGDGTATEYTVDKIHHPDPASETVIGTITPDPLADFGVTGDDMYPKPA